MKFLSKLEKQPWSGDDSSPAGVAGAFFLLASAILIVPFIAQKFLGERLTLPDILLFSAMPGVCAYGFFVAGKLPLRLLTVKEVFQCIGWGIVIILISGVVSVLWQMVLFILNIPFEKEQFAMTLIRESHGGELIKLFFALCVFTPLIEELLFRRIIYGFFLKWGYRFAFLFTALIFSFCHFFIAGLPGLFVLGLGFQLGYLKFRNLSAAVLLHALFNSCSFFAVICKTI